MDENQKAEADLKAEKKALGLSDEADNEDNTLKSDEEDEDSKEKKPKAEDKDEDESEEESDKEEESDEEESDEEDESEEEDEDESEEDEEEDDDKSDKSKSKPQDKKHIPVAKLQRVKEKFREKETSYLETINDLKDQLSKKGEAKTDEEKAKVEDEVQNLAKKLELDDPTVLQEIIDLARKGMKSDIPEELAKTLESFQKSQLEKQEVEHFSKEWQETAVPEMKKLYPDIKDDSLKEAQKLMDELSHSEKWFKYDLDYILFKNKDKFDAILHSPKKKGLESSRSGFKGEESANRTDNGRLVPDNPSKSDIDRASRKYAEIQAEGTLIKGAAPKSLK